MSKQVKVNHDEGTVYVPGSGNLPLIGVDPKKLEEREKVNARNKLHLRRQVLSTWRCTQCKRTWSGKFVRVKWELIDGIRTELLVCPDKRCDGPVVVFKDAFDLMNAPREERAELRRTQFSFNEMSRCTAVNFGKFLETEYRKSGLNAQVEIGRQVQCSTCTECLILRRDWRWEVVR
jgi:hypothetical protein